MKQKLRIIFNPVAGQRQAPKIAKLVDASGLADAFEVETIQSDYPGHATLLSAEAVREKYYAVVAVGGDGTVNEVAKSLLHSSTALGVIPAGSGNGLARHLGMRLKPVEGLMQIKNAVVTPIDSLIINGSFSINVSGFGFDGYVAWLFNQSGKRGFHTYTRIGLEEYFKYAPAVFDIKADDMHTSVEAQMLVIANASQFGNAAIIAPNAQLEDGLMDLVAVKKPPAWLLPGMMMRMFNGTLQDNQFVQTLHCKKLEAVASRPLHLHIDGEAQEPIERIKVEIIPASINILMPTGK